MRLSYVFNFAIKERRKYVLGHLLKLSRINRP